MRAPLISLFMLGWLVWMAPQDGMRPTSTWSAIGEPFANKEDCVDFLFAFTKAKPDLLEGHMITCRREGIDPNQFPGQTVPFSTMGADHTL